MLLTYVDDEDVIVTFSPVVVCKGHNDAIYFLLWENSDQMLSKLKVFVTDIIFF